jgi:DNA recombination protein RmuC
MPDVDLAAPLTLALLAAALGWLLALVLAVVWRRSSPFAAECAELRGRLSDGDQRAVADAGEIRRLSVEEAGLRQAVEGLERRLEDAAAERVRIAEEAKAERAALEERLEEARVELADLRVVNEQLRTEGRERGRAHEEEVRRLGQIREDMTDRFKRLADETMRLHGDNFARVSDEKLRALLEPMRQHIGRFQDELRQTHTGAAQERERLKTEIEMLSRRSEQISSDAVALARALRGEKQKQGAWGEMILERLLEESGLAKGREYETQFQVRDEEGGRRRPDVVVRLPGGKAVVIDAKVSLVAYEAAVNSEDEEERHRQLRVHVAALRKHIDDLAARDYASLVDGSVDYVLMFMPVEGALAAALDVEGDLTAYAIERRVGIATPTTLMMALRTVQHVWNVERRESNAEEIAHRAGKLFDKMSLVIESFEKVGTALDAARSAHDEAFDRLARGNGNVVRQFEMMRKLGAKAGRALPPGYVDVPEGDERAALAPGAATRPARDVEAEAAE